MIERALSAGGPLTRQQMRDRIAQAGLPADGSAVLLMLMLASLRGIAVRGPMIVFQHSYVHVREWLGKPLPDLEEGVALAELARRYLAGHGLESHRDLTKWAGLTVGQARRGLAAIGAELRDRPDGVAELSSGSAKADGPPEPRPPRVLRPGATRLVVP